MNMKASQKTHALISSDRVEGTNIYSSHEDKIGTVEKLLIEKRGGRVTDAIVSVGGFLGIGEEKHSIPWSLLEYDTNLDGYKINVTKEQFQDAPRFKAVDADQVHDRNYQASVYEYWSVPAYWL